MDKIKDNKTIDADYAETGKLLDETDEAVETKILDPELDDKDEAVETKILDPELDDKEGSDVGVVVDVTGGEPEEADAEEESSEEKEASSSLVVADPLQRYLAEISRYKLLSREEEVDLAKRYQEKGDVEAAYSMVVANLRLVVKIAYEFRRNIANLMDLIQEGNIGLMRAVEKFDPYKGVRLSSYSAWWIRAYMIRYLLNNWSLVKVGTTQNQRRLFFNLKKAKEELEAQGFRPEPKLLASKLNVKESEVIEMDMRMAGSDISLDAPLTDDSESTRMDFVPGDGLEPEHAYEAAEVGAFLRESLKEFRKTLSDRDKQIFDQRLVAEDPITLRELGEEFGVSRERVRQLEAEVKRKLKEFLEEREGMADVID